MPELDGLDDGLASASCTDEPHGTMTLLPVPEAVSRARRWFRFFLEPHKPTCSMDDCMLVISELVTNAIVHGEAEEGMRVQLLWRREGTDLHVEVHNPGTPEKVKQRPHIKESEHGRGLWLVDMLTDSWKAGPGEQGGTVVSFVMTDAWPK